MGVTLTVEKMEFRQLTEEIKRTMRRSARDAVQLGFMLRRVMDECLWETDYSSFDDYLQEELHMDYSLASRFMAINKKFSLRGNSMDINPEYREYSQGALIEMLNMSPELEEKVTPEMTVRQVREIKRQAKREKEKPVPGQEETEVVIDGEYREVPKEPEEEIATSQPESEDEPHNEHWFVRKYMEIRAAEAETLAGLCRGKRINTELAKEVQKYISPYGVHSSGCSEWDFDFRSFSKGLDMRIGKEETHFTYKGFIEVLMDVVGEKENDVAEYVSTVKWMLSEEKKRLRDYIQFDDIPEMTVLRQEIMVAALELMDKKMEAEELEQEEAEQPELPPLKNADLCKEWLRNYKAWGLWYRDENIDVNYYKYDFPDGSRLIVSEYPQRHSYYDERVEDEYYYHLLEKGKKGYGQIRYDEKYRYNSEGEAYLAAFLKNIQKK